MRLEGRLFHTTHTKWRPRPSITAPMGAWVYILQCRDDSYYIGSTSRDIETRVLEHNSGVFDGYTARR